jgi:hypothetical protein
MQKPPYSMKAVRRGVYLYSEKVGTIAYLLTKEGIVVVGARFA